MSSADQSRLHLDVNALRGPRSISPLTYAIAIPGLFLSSFEAELILPGSGLADAFVIAVASALISALVLFAADKTVLRARAYRLMPLAVVLAVYVLCGIVRAIVTSISAAAVDAQGPEFTVRSLGGVILVVAWLSIIAIVLDYADRDRAATLALRQRKAQLTLQRDHYGVALARGRKAIGALVDSVVEPAISQSELLLRRVNTNDLLDPEAQAAQLAQLAFEVRDRAEGQVRDLSHLLASDEAQFNDVELLAEAPPIDVVRGPGWFRRALKQASAIDPIQPLAVTLTVLIEAIPLFTYLFGFRGLLQCAVIGSVVTFSFLWLARRVLTPRLRHWNQYIRVVALLAVVLLTAVLATASIRLWWPPETDELVAIGLRSFWVFLIAMVVWAIIASSAAQTVRARSELGAAVAEIEWQVESLRTALTRVQRSAAEIVHGRVQGRIVAAALAVSMQARRLEREKAGALEATPRVLAEALGILTEARADVREIQDHDAQRNATGIDALLDSIVQSWHAVVTVSTTIEHGARVRIDSDSTTQSRVAGVVREAVSNAARHGAARKVDVAVELDEELLRICATDDGIGLRSTIEPGFGLHQFQVPGSSWTLTNVPDAGARLTVTFPVR